MNLNEEKLLNTVLSNISDTIQLYDDSNKLIFSNHKCNGLEKLVENKEILFNNKKYYIKVLSSKKNINDVEIDELTGFLTKGAFKKKVVEFELNNFENYVVIFCDIDNLKSFNDKYGHFETDKIIKGTAKIIQNNLQSDDIVGKFGGDEFVIILNNTLISKVYNRIDKIRKEIFNKIYSLKSLENNKIDDVSVSVTFGVAKESSVIKSLITADNLLINGKKQRKNSIYGINMC